MLKVLIFVVLALLTGFRVQVWHDEVRLWGDAVAKAPSRPRTLVNYGRALQMTGRVDEAIAMYQRAIAASFDDRRLKTGNLYARLAAETNTATALLYRQQIAPAARILTAILQNTDWPAFPAAVYQRGILRAYAGECEAARGDWALALRLEGVLVPPARGTPCVLVN